MAISDQPLSTSINPNPIRRTCTVTFGLSSFLARSLASALLHSGDWTVRVADPLPSPSPSPSDPIQYLQVDFADRAQVRAAVDGSSVVFHVDPAGTAAVPARDFLRRHAIAVQGTKNLIRSCRECGVRRLVYTGNADVVFDGVHDLCGVDESIPFPEKSRDEVNELRTQVEMLVLNANGKGGLLTCSLRPSNPFGPGDYLLPFLVTGMNLGLPTFMIGSGKNICDFTYVENVAHANICAEQALHSGAASVAGEPFFITNCETVKLQDFVVKVLEGLGCQRPRVHLPINLSLLLVVLVERVQEYLGICGTSNPFSSHSMIRSLSCTRTYDCSKAQRLIGYSPIVSVEDGIMISVKSFSQLEECSHYSRECDFTKPSKAEALLGSGKVADILLWRDEKRTFTCSLASFLLFYWFLICGKTFVSSTAGFLLVFSLFLYCQDGLPSSMFGFSVGKMPSSYFEISESAVRHSLVTLASIWNRGFGTLKLVAQGDDWNVFIKVAGSLYIVRLLLPVSLSMLIAVGLICLFTFFIVYEQCEREVDKVMDVAASGVNKLKELLIAKLPNTLVMFVKSLQ